MLILSCAAICLVNNPQAISLSTSASRLLRLVPESGRTSRIVRHDSNNLLRHKRIKVTLTPGDRADCTDEFFRAALLQQITARPGPQQLLQVASDDGRPGGVP